MTDKKNATTKKGGKEEKFLSEWDMFAAPMPGYSYQGMTQVGTWVGFMATILLFFMMAFYA